MSKLSVAGKDFHALLVAVTKFGSIGGIAGADNVYLYAEGGKLHAAMTGVVQAIASVECKGKLECAAVDERLLQPFASQIAKTAKQVVIECTDNKEIKLSARGRSITAPLNAVQITPSKELYDNKTKKFVVTASIANDLKYLSSVAFSDSSRPELCCVLLVEGGEAVACNQKAVAFVQCGYKGVTSAVPLAIAKNVSVHDVLYLGTKESILLSGIGRYAIPAPVKAQSSFPLDALKKMSTVASDLFATVNGKAFATAIRECDMLIGAISKLEIAVDLAIVDDRIDIVSTNGGARFQRSLPVIKAGGGTLKLPLDELAALCPLLETEEEVKISKGKANGETLLSFPRGFCVSAAWRSK